MQAGPILTAPLKLSDRRPCQGAQGEAHARLREPAVCRLSTTAARTPCVLPALPAELIDRLVDRCKCPRQPSKGVAPTGRPAAARVQDEVGAPTQCAAALLRKRRICAAVLQSGRVEGSGPPQPARWAAGRCAGGTTAGRQLSLSRPLLCLPGSCSACLTGRTRSLSLAIYLFAGLATHGHGHEHNGEQLIAGSL